MSSPFASLKLKEPELLHDQIGNHVRELIRSKTLAPDEKLPSTRELAEMWQTHIPTVHFALAKLVKEGLLVRYPRKGTFVRGHPKKLVRVGTYYANNTWFEDAPAFQRVLHKELNRELARHRIANSIWIDPRPDGEQETPWDALSRAIRDREIQGLIVPAMGAPQFNWLPRLPIPCACFTSTNAPGKVLDNARQFVRLSLTCLKEQGCRSVGWICGICPEEVDQSGRHAHHVEFAKCFVRTARELGLTVQNDWLRYASAILELHPTRQERFGYRQFQALWRLARRPEGLVGFPDLISRGIVVALLENQLRIPDDIKVVLHKDLEVDMLCPLPVTFVTASAREAANALVSQVIAQSRGERTKPIVLPFTLQKPATGKEPSPAEVAAGPA